MLNLIILAAILTATHSAAFYIGRHPIKRST